MNLICKICNWNSKNKKSLKSHLQTKHVISTFSYTLENFYNNIRPFCVCGCGLETRYYSFGFKKYRTGHNPGNNNGNFTKETLQRKFGWEGKLVKKEILCGFNNPKTREKSKQTCFKKYGVYNPYQIKEIKEKANINRRSSVAKRTPSYQIDLCSQLKKVDVGFELEFLVNKKIVDICNPEKKIAIECQGDYYHCNPKKYQKDYLNKKKNLYAYQIWAEDEHKKQILEINGYKVFAFWQSDILNNREGIVEVIRREIIK